MAAITKAIASSRSTGVCSLQGRGLTSVPSALYDSDEVLPATGATAAGAESKWWEVSELTKVDLSRNEITALPDALCMLPAIQHLDVSNNALQELPRAIANMQALKLLSCDSNRILQLPDTLPRLGSLVVLTGTRPSSNIQLLHVSSRSHMSSLYIYILSIHFAICIVLCSVT